MSHIHAMTVGHRARQSNQPLAHRSPDKFYLLSGCGLYARSARTSPAICFTWNTASDKTWHGPSLPLRVRMVRVASAPRSDLPVAGALGADLDPPLSSLGKGGRVSGRSRPRLGSIAPPTRGSATSLGHSRSRLELTRRFRSGFWLRCSCVLAFPSAPSRGPDGPGTAQPDPINGR